ncbi:hypothetical protein Y032_0107g3818 [Ancylostoma ceylanicum]|uniref:Uncharacterized protein n=1 Tax=Ancylostoma ceylanicum TaxID=53326 RepID=A0A016TES8_9BILA|nr:hypothetical protein Y032_0107g3818 [Ancylostoma ceylanicum]
MFRKQGMAFIVRPSRKRSLSVGDNVQHTTSLSYDDASSVKVDPDDPLLSPRKPRRQRRRFKSKVGLCEECMIYACHSLLVLFAEALGPACII